MNKKQEEQIAGLCVRYDCDNFGSMLQILATQRIINRCHWKYEIIRYDKMTVLFLIKNLSRLFNPYFMKGKIETLLKHIQLKKHPYIKEGNDLRNKRIDEYRKKYIGPLSKVYKGYNSLTQSSKDYDAFIVGSDQLWTPAGIKSKFYNLLFVDDNIKKISFATSFGVSQIPRSQIEMTKKYLNRIDYISVREKQGADIVENLIHKKAFVSLDPTLLLTVDEWEKEFSSTKMNDKYIFAYFLGHNIEHRKAVEELQKETGLKVLTVPFMDGFVEYDVNFGDEQIFDIGPIDFLNYIRNATYICTDSYHGSIFSILHHKQFLTFNRTNSNDKNSRNSRIDSLFTMLNLNNRRYDDRRSITEQICDKINYDDVDSRLHNLREESIEFIDNALNG